MPLPRRPSQSSSTSSGAGSGEVLLAVHRLQDARARAQERLCQRVGVRDNDLRALEYVVDAHSAGRSVSPKDLAASLGLTSASITALLDRLERAGHVSRITSPFDRRGLFIEPSADTAAVIQSTYDTIEYDLKAITARLGSERVRAALELYAELADALDRMTGAAE